MKKITIQIERDTGKSMKQMGERFIKTWKTGKSSSDHLSFESPAALFRALSPTRWELLERLQAVGPISLRGLARELDRDVKRVHGDVAALMGYGLIDKTDDGLVRVPYQVIHADFDLKAVAA